MLNKFEVFQIAKIFYWEYKELKVPNYLKDQLLRASSSIALNIAESSEKRTPQYQSKFYSIALDNLRECPAIIELEKIDNPLLVNHADKLGAILLALTRKYSK